MLLVMKAVRIRIVVIHDALIYPYQLYGLVAENIPGDIVITVSGAESDATVTVTATVRIWT